jgi:hypothetical protein
MVRLRSFALASICSALEMDFSNPQASLPQHGWDLKSINSLMESTTKLIQHSVKVKITPTINRFAQATIDKIQNEVLPALNEEHQVSQDLLDREFNRFQELTAEIDAKRDNITSKDKECHYGSVDHTECRNQEHTVTSAVTECEEEASLTESELINCRDYLKVVEGEMQDTWCDEASFDALSKDVFRSSQATMKLYIEYKHKCESIRKEWEERKTVCKTTAHDHTELRSRCNSVQSTLEECSCERANMVLYYGERFTLRWHDLDATYNDLITESANLEAQRVKEYTGLKIVMCLLYQVVDLSNMDQPCNASHVEQVTQEVEDCHEEHHDTDHLKLISQPAPDMPPLYEQIAYPCGADFIAEYYGHLPEDARAKECDAHHCSERLMQQVVEEPPIEHR